VGRDQPVDFDGQAAEDGRMARLSVCLWSIITERLNTECGEEG